MVQRPLLAEGVEQPGSALLPAAVSDAMQEPSCCVGGAANGMTRSMRAVLVAETMFDGKSAAFFYFAYFALFWRARRVAYMGL